MDDDSAVTDKALDQVKNKSTLTDVILDDAEDEFSVLKDAQEQQPFHKVSEF